MVRDTKRGREREGREGRRDEMLYGMKRASFSHSAYSIYVSPGRHGPHSLQSLE